ncbi:FAD/NAD(P)-binding protein [Kutzneria chonburiensis]|uniref:FAD/NAD(P)-binding protein n=1 Tax=Kutzneria chonburiensis TaxID=1483604 RepID=A0ABV6MQ95_9PSEU|nr:FAD/NAD(P)-binding protein [Kutzneria chonburiensis]
MREKRRFRVAIVGCGPRGLGVLERLLVRLRRGPSDRDVVIWAIDPVEHGPGQVWRTDQADWYATNATAAELTAQSFDFPGRPQSYADWAGLDADSARQVYPSRAEYGRYLRETFARLCASTPPGVRVFPLTGTATALRRTDGRLHLSIDDGHPDLLVDKVILATGHSGLEPDDEDRALSAHGHYIRGGMAATMPLDEIEPGRTVAIRGLGLTFYDVTRALTIGRGGRFVRADGQLCYQPSGAEPRLVAGSRSGLPFRARAELNEPAELAPRPVILSDDRLAELREDAAARRGRPQLDFAAEVEPLIVAELEHAYRRRDGHGPLDVDALANPFNCPFAGRDEFRSRLLDVLRDDVARAKAGSTVDPVKAALEVMRSLRPLMPDVVDFDGLLPDSQRDFLTRWAPMSFLLSAGPPVEHVEQLVALIEAGVLDVVGPGARFEASEPGRFAVESPSVAGSRRLADVLLDARAPGADLRRDTNPLLRQLLADGMISEHVNVDPLTGRRFASGGLAITESPFHVLDAKGRPDPDVHALGVVTQNTRWFTQVGTGRPGRDSPFRRDADAIAVAVLAGEVRSWPVPA